MTDAEDLAAIRRDYPINAITWEELTQKARENRLDYAEVYDYAVGAPQRAIDAGYVLRIEGEK